MKGILENIKSNVFILYVRTWCFMKTELVPKGIQQIIVKDKTKSKPKFCSSDVICNILAWVCFFYSTYLFCCIYWRKQIQNGNTKVNTSLAPASSCRMEFIHKNFHKDEQEFCKKWRVLYQGQDLRNHCLRAGNLKSALW